MAASIDIRNVDCPVGANQSVMRFRNQHAAFSATTQRPSVSASSDTRVDVNWRPQPREIRRRSDRRKIDKPPSALRHDLVLDDEDVALLQSLLLAL